MKYITLYCPTPIMKQAHVTIHYPQKLLNSIIIQYWRSIHIHYLHHARTHPSLSKLLKSNIFFSLLNHFSSHPHQEKTSLIHILSIPSQIHLWFLKTRLLHHLFYDIHINATQTPPSHPCQEKTALITILSVLSQIHIWLQNPAFYITSSMTSTSILHKKSLLGCIIPRVLCYIMPTINILTTQHTHLTPIIHNILSITIYVYTRHPIKNHLSSQPL